LSIDEENASLELNGHAALKRGRGSVSSVDEDEKEENQDYQEKNQAKNDGNSHEVDQEQRMNGHAATGADMMEQSPLKSSLPKKKKRDGIVVSRKEEGTVVLVRRKRSEDPQSTSFHPGLLMANDESSWGLGGKQCM